MNAQSMEIPVNGECELTRVNSPLFEIALVLVRLDHVASIIVNVSHGIESSTIKRAFG
jgi:hypothetical protein